MEIMRRLVQEEEGQGMVEYALILGIIAVGVVGLFPAMRTAISGIFTKISTALTTANS
jgi:pilus assembly protein Flp/PilA